MKKYLSIVAVIITGLLAGCGGQTPEDQVREVMIKSIEAAKSDHPSSMCPYTTKPEECMQGIVMAKAMGMDVDEIIKGSLPKDWRKQAKKAKVTINGDKATMSSIFKGEKSDNFVKKDGTWLTVS